MCAFLHLRTTSHVFLLLVTTWIPLAQRLCSLVSGDSHRRSVDEDARLRLDRWLFYMVAGDVGRKMVPHGLPSTRHWQSTSHKHRLMYVPSLLDSPAEYPSSQTSQPVTALFNFAHRPSWQVSPGICLL